MADPEGTMRTSWRNKQFGMIQNQVLLCFRCWASGFQNSWSESVVRIKSSMLVLGATLVRWGCWPIPNGWPFCGVHPTPEPRHLGSFGPLRGCPLLSSCSLSTSGKDWPSAIEFTPIWSLQPFTTRWCQSWGLGVYGMGLKTISAPSTLSWDRCPSRSRLAPPCKPVRRTRQLKLPCFMDAAPPEF